MSAAKLGASAQIRGPAAVAAPPASGGRRVVDVAPLTAGVPGFHVVLRERQALCEAPGQVWVRDEGPAERNRVSEALYLRDPDQNGVELYWDRPRERWPVGSDGTLAMFTRRLDLNDLSREPA